MCVDVWMTATVKLGEPVMLVMTAAQLVGLVGAAALAAASSAPQCL